MKCVLISGGAGGIGSEIVKAFADQGYFVYILDTDTASARHLADHYGANICAAVEVDVRDVAALKTYAATWAPDATLDHIITLAGRALPEEWRPFDEQRPEDVEGSVQLNLLGHLNVIHTFLPYLKKTGGDRSILMVSSINAITSYALPVYSAAKAGLLGFMTGIVTELGQDGIRINTVSPGTVVTAATLQEPKDYDALRKTTALDRFATAADVAELVFHICNDYGSVTGQNFVIDAGQTRKH